MSQLHSRRIVSLWWLPTAALVVLCSIATANAQSTLADLAENQQWEELTKALPKAKDVDSTQGDGMTALHWAAWHGHVDSVVALLNQQADIEATTEYQVTPLSLACERGHSSIIRLFTNLDVDVEAARMGKERPLMLAARNGDPESVFHLIDHGAKLDAKEVKGQTALMWAAAAGNVEAVDELVKAGADVNVALPKSGFTAFHFAARQGKTKVVEQLLEAGVDINAVMETNKTGGRNPRKNMSALLIAIESGHLELALRLVELGADPNDQRSGFAPLHAISWVRKTQVGDNPSGDPAPRITGSVSSLEFVRLMIEAGADVDLKIAKGKSPGKVKLNRKGMTPFLFAASTADIPMMKLLLELGADSNTTNADDCTAMMACAGVGVVAVGEEPGTEEEVNEGIRMLERLGVNPNAVDANGETAMHGAAYRNYPSTVKVLTELGATPKVWDRKNKYGWTPRMIASGKRPGSLKPSPETIAALDEATAQSK